MPLSEEHTSSAKGGNVDPMRGEITYAWGRGIIAINEIVVHALITLSVVVAIEAVDWIIRLMTGSDGLVFFKGAGPFEFKARWLFDAADIGLLVLVAIHGVATIYKAYRGKSNV
jgi:hypothetical protein